MPRRWLYSIKYSSHCYTTEASLVLAPLHNSYDLCITDGSLLSTIRYLLAYELTPPRSAVDTRELALALPCGPGWIVVEPVSARLLHPGCLC